MIALLLRWLAVFVGVRVHKVSVSVDRWPKDAEHNAGERFLRLYVGVTVLGRFMDVEVRL